MRRGNVMMTKMILVVAMASMATVMCSAAGSISAPASRNLLQHRSLKQGKEATVKHKHKLMRGAASRMLMSGVPEIVLPGQSQKVRRS